MPPCQKTAVIAFLQYLDGQCIHEQEYDGYNSIFLGKKIRFVQQGIMDCNQKYHSFSWASQFRREDYLTRYEVKVFIQGSTRV